ncbi:hypothetical protein BC835DRAFT_1309122 [Cytidiella melzeri]|nr:hypothetical protein BC835DRAFT_1309122 [Cytidiella melzeri]
MAGNSNDKEYVADSEDEDMLVNTSFDVSVAAQIVQTPDTSIELATKQHFYATAFPSPPPIAILAEATESSSSAAPSLSSPHANRNGTEILRASSGPSSGLASNVTSGAAAPVKGRPKPRPRPAFKVQPLLNGSATASSAVPQAAAPTASSLPGLPLRPDTTPHQPSKSAQSTATTSGSLQPAVPLDILTFSGDISERAKMRSRTKASEAAQNKSKAKPVVTAVIELTSDSEDELSLLPPKSKAKGKTKDSLMASTTHRSPKRANESDAPDSTVNTLLTATSDIIAHPSSQLLPSDVPLPSSSVPSTLNPGLAGSPPSSPIPQVISRKRKKPVASLSDDEESTRAIEKDSQKRMPPPPLRGNTSVVVEPSTSVRQTDSTAAKAGPSSTTAVPKSKSKARKTKATEDGEGDSDYGDKPKLKAQRKNQKKKPLTEVESESTITTKGHGMGQEVAKRLVMEVVVSPTKKQSPRKSTLNKDERDDQVVSVSNVEKDVADGRDIVAVATMADNAKEQYKEPSAAGNQRKGKGKARKRAVLSSDEEDSDCSARRSAVARKRISQDNASMESPSRSRPASTRASSSKAGLRKPLRQAHTDHSVGKWRYRTHQ